MKNTLTTLILSILTATAATAGTVSVNDAQKAAANFYHLKSNSRSVVNGTLKYTRTEMDGTVDFYVFDFAPAKGFVIISANDNLTPIIGYSIESNFNTQFAKTGLNDWMNHAASHIYQAIQDNAQASQKISAQWIAYLQGNKPAISKSEVVTPLLATAWGQDTFYNQACPYNSTDNQTCQAGCVAVAMAQIMKYWNYPAQGTGSFVYDNVPPNFLWNYGTQTANFGTTTYNWSAMPNHLNDTNNNVANLIYQCGVAAEMSYGDMNQGGSSAYTLASEAPSWHNTAQSAFASYFSYNPNTLQGVIEAQYTSTAWVSMLETELLEGRPVQYVGYDSIYGGHAWVCDGFDENDNFHMNWGWNGLGNGYFSLNSLSTEGFDFSTKEAALIGIQPNVTLPVQAEPSSYSICQGETVNLISRGPDFATYTWLPSDGLSCPNCPTATAAPNATTTYTLTVDSAGFRASVSFTVYVKAAPIVDSMAVSDVTTHGGKNGSISLLMTNPAKYYTFDWNNGDTSNYIRNLSAGLYSVTITDSTGCSFSLSQAISQPAIIFSPSVQLTPSTYVNVYGGFTQKVTGNQKNSSATDNNNIGDTETAVSEVAKENSLNVYPNPATTQVYVELGNTDEADMTVRNNMGQILMSSHISAFQTQIDLSSFASGVYFVQIEQAGRTMVKEFVKK